MRFVRSTDYHRLIMDHFHGSEPVCLGNQHQNKGIIVPDSDFNVCDTHNQHKTVKAVQQRYTVAPVAVFPGRAAGIDGQ